MKVSEYSNNKGISVQMTESETKEWLERLASYNSLKETSPSIDDFDYVDEDEICPDTACETPRFIVDFDHKGIEPVLAETGKPIDVDAAFAHTMVIQDELDAIARSIADNIMTQELK